MKFSLPHNGQKGRNTTGGFTLLEMLVSTSLFIVVMLVIVSALLSLELASRKARTIRIAADNVSAAISSMSRAIRMGSYIHCGCTGSHATLATPLDCKIDNAGTGVISPGNGDTCIAFEAQNGDPMIDDDQFVYRLQNNRIQRSTRSGDANTWYDMTAPEIVIDSLAFYVGGSELNENQPFVTILVRGTATSSSIKVNTAFDIQTTVAVRTPNFDLIP